MNNIDFETASFKEFENIPGLDPYQRADLFNDYSVLMMMATHTLDRVLNAWQWVMNKEGLSL